VTRLEKWQGAGNAYLVLDDRERTFRLGPAQAALLCDPRRGIGADGVLLVGDSPIADVSLRIVNPDGSDAEACGNGTRMVARRTCEARGTTEATIESAAGVLRCRLHEDGTVTARLADATLSSPAYRPTEADAFPYVHRFVSMGNPHVAIRVHDPDAFPLGEEGPRLEHHPWLPQRANIEVWTTDGPQAVRMRVWERGVGETDACGSGACAVAVAAVLDDAVRSPVAVSLPGGTLTVAVGDDLSVEMTGPAERIATIELAPELVARLAG
jgi:diaminopimelate epimerase